MKNSILIVLLALLVAECKAQEPSVIMLLSNITVLAGQDATIPCTYEAVGGITGTPTLKWSAVRADGSRQRLYIFKEGDEGVTGPDASEKRGFTVDTSGALIMTQAMLADNEPYGRLVCEVDFGKQASNEATLTFLVVVQADSEPVATLEGSDFTVDQDAIIGSCQSGSAFPDPVITFYRESEEIFSKADGVSVERTPESSLEMAFLDDKISTANSDGTVSIKRSLSKVIEKEDDDALFTCVVTSGGKTMETRLVQNTTFAKFRVNYPTDNVMITADPIDAFVGSTVLLKCEANGYPEPSIDFNGNSAKTLNVAVTKDTGNSPFVCTARYSESGPEVSDTHTIVALYSELPTVSGKTEVNVGGMLSLTCESMSNPRSNVMWMKGGNVVSNDGMLMIHKMKYTDSGNYVCKAENSHRVLNKETMVTVQVNGLSLDTTKDFEVKGELKEEVTLECKVISNPKPTITWSRKSGDDSDLQYEAAVPGSIPNEYISTLTVGPLDPGMSSEVFTCTAMNAAGTQERMYKLPVFLPVSNKTNQEEPTQVLAEKASSPAPGIIIGILVALLVVAIIIAVLYNRGIICKKGEKGEENAEDIAVELNKDGGGDVEAANKPDAAAPVGESDKLVNGDK